MQARVAITMQPVLMVLWDMGDMGPILLEAPLAVSSMAEDIMPR